MYSNEQQKILPFMIMSFCLGFGSLFGFIVFGQQESYTITEPSYKPIVSDGGIENTEKGTPSINSGSETTIKLITPTRGGISKENGGIKETSPGGVQPLLRTGDKKVLVRGFPEDSLAVEYMTYAYQISNGDMDFLMTMKAENGGFDINKQSNVWTNGVREDSWGLCQLHRRWHSKIVDDPRFFTDYKWHIEQCWIKYKNGTRFYGYDVRLKYKNDFTIID